MEALHASLSEEHRERAEALLEEPGEGVQAIERM
jgi:hypothetical protein